MKNSMENVTVIFSFFSSFINLFFLACDDYQNCDGCSGGPNGFGCSQCAPGYHKNNLHCESKISFIFLFNLFLQSTLNAQLIIALLVLIQQLAQNAKMVFIQKIISA